MKQKNDKDFWTNKFDTFLYDEKVRSIWRSNVFVKWFFFQRNLITKKHMRKTFEYEINMRYASFIQSTMFEWNSEKTFWCGKKWNKLLKWVWMCGCVFNHSFECINLLTKECHFWWRSGFWCVYVSQLNLSLLQFVHVCLILRERESVFECVEWWWFNRVKYHYKSENAFKTEYQKHIRVLFFYCFPFAIVYPKTQFMIGSWKCHWFLVGGSTNGTD